MVNEQEGKQVGVVEEQSDVNAANPRALQEYLSTMLSTGSGAPLPILNQIINGYMPLINYQLNEVNANSFAQSLQCIVPKVLRKMYLVNNSLKDKDVAKLFHDLSETSGLQQIGIIGNGLGL